MLYDIHMYATVRVKINNLEAVDMRNGIKKAGQETDLYEMFPHTVIDGGHIETEYAEEVTAFLVDVVGDEDYIHSTLFNADEELTLYEPPGGTDCKPSAAAEEHNSPGELVTAVQTLLGNAQYYGDGYTLVLTADIESVQAGLRTEGIVPNEPQG